ncbi:AAA ATPase [Tulasnella sp. JGI-2019a]|nr:AAA ATPase [Tulasnella sp. JGI-2019a]KAG9005353.1 AAA ATPase [Tulasnella sp. JGI-2019a]KAG9032826.1 AAA ATPase [Tulasnella sp. JGI-2019a]
MVLGKRSRNSLASSTSSSATTVASTSTSSIASTPASSVPGSPAPSLKRARTRESTCSLVEEVYNGKENILPDNWFVCGRDAEGNSGSGEDDAAEDDEEGGDTDVTIEEESPVRMPTRQTRSRARVANATPTRPSPRLSRTHSMPTNVVVAPDTPPPTPFNRRPRPNLTSTPSVRLSKLTIQVDDETLEEDSTVPSPALPSPPKEQSIYAQARTLLRGGTTSSLNNTTSRIVMAARDKERGTIESYLLCGGFLSPNGSMDGEQDVISSLYISGSPGTGKTALITDILQKLQDRDDLQTHAAVYVNCMGLSDVKAVWERVWEALLQTLGGCTSSKLKAGDAKKYFEDALKRDQGLRCILILDEIDFISRTPAALSEVYSMARKYPATLRMIGISNTLTLGSEAINTPATPTKASRSGSASTIISYTGPEKSINFSAYTSEDLLSIINSRLSALQPAERDAMFMPVALNFLCKKVAASNGDVRFALSVLRRCVDAVEREVNSPLPSSTSPSKRGGRVEMKHVLESLRAHENGSSGSSASSTNADGTSGKGSGVSRTVRGLGLHARLAIVALLIGWKRVEAGLPLATQTTGGPVAPDKITTTSLFALYVTLLTTDVVDSRGDMSSASSFRPVTRSEFQDILGVLETSGLVSFTQTAPVFASPSKLSSSSPTASLVSSASFTTPPKTPTRPRITGRSASMKSFSLPTPPSMSGGSGSGRRKASSAKTEPFMVLCEGVREDEVVRGLITSTTGVSSSEKKAGVVEKEIESLWERECRRLKKEVEKRERRKIEDEEQRRMNELAFEE